MVRAEDIEEAVWAFVSEMLCEPERVRAGVRQLAEQERSVRRSRLDPDKEARLLAEKVSECARKRSAYQDQQAAGLMTLAELSEKLADLEETRRYAESEIAMLRASEERAKEIEEHGEALVRDLSAAASEAIRLLPPEDKLGLYERLDLEVRNSPGGYRVSGVFCDPEPLPT